MLAISPNYITDEQGLRTSVVLPIGVFQRLLELLEELEDIRLYDEVKARNEPSISFDEFALRHRNDIYQ